jgi:cytoskeletal protein RodZ
MKFKIKKIPTLKMSIGDRLKRARKRKKISLEKLEEITKVRKRYLEDIERNNFNNLPSPVYARGFLYKYASAVNIDPNEILDLFKQDQVLNNDSNQNLNDVLPKKNIKYPKVFITPKFILTALSVLLFLGFATYIYLQVSGFARAPELNIKNPLSTQLSIDSSSLKFDGSTSSGASVYINDQPIGVDLNGNFSEDVRLNNGINEIKISAKNKINKVTSKVYDVAVTLPSLAINAPTVLGNKSSTLDLKIQVDPNPVWLSVESDGKTVFQGVMLKDTSQEFQAEQEITINSGNAGSTHIFLNGKDMGTLGNEGEVKQGVKYTINMIK